MALMASFNDFLGFGKTRIFDARELSSKSYSPRSHEEPEGDGDCEREWYKEKLGIGRSYGMKDPRKRRFRFVSESRQASPTLFRPGRRSQSKLLDLIRFFDNQNVAVDVDIFQLLNDTRWPLDLKPVNLFSLPQSEVNPSRLLRLIGVDRIQISHDFSISDMGNQARADSQAIAFDTVQRNLQIIGFGELVAKDFYCAATDLS